MDFVNRWSDLTEIAVVWFVLWLGISRSKFYNGRAHYGMLNEHNGSIPRDFWLEDWEKKAIIRFYHEHPLEGYRRLTFMMLDRDVVAVSPATVWRLLAREDLLCPWKPTPSKKGAVFQQSLRPHQHWHMDVSYINTTGEFYYPCTCAVSWTDAADITGTGVSGNR
ncbi:MAG: transposase [Thermodesulfobacteriota bacterium]